jgi:hypothetical protein
VGADNTRHLTNSIRKSAHAPVEAHGPLIAKALGSYDRHGVEAAGALCEGSSGGSSEVGNGGAEAAIAERLRQLDRRSSPRRSATFPFNMSTLGVRHLGRPL